MLVEGLEAVGDLVQDLAVGAPIDHHGPLGTLEDLIVVQVHFQFIETLPGENPGLHSVGQ